MNDFRLRFLTFAAALALALPTLAGPARAQTASAPPTLVPLAPLAECHVGVVAILALATASNGKLESQPWLPASHRLTAAELDR